MILETRVSVRLNPWREIEYINNSSNWRGNILLWYLSAAIICSEKRTVFLKLSSRKTVSLYLQWYNSDISFLFDALAMIRRLSVGKVSRNLGDEILANKLRCCHGEISWFPMIISTAVHTSLSLSRALLWRQRPTSCHWKQRQLPVATTRF